jgi:hypothetical protein
MSDTVDGGNTKAEHDRAHQRALPVESMAAARGMGQSPHSDQHRRDAERNFDRKQIRPDSCRQDAGSKRRPDRRRHGHHKRIEADKDGGGSKSCDWSSRTALVRRINPEACVQASVTEPDHLFFQKRNTASQFEPGSIGLRELGRAVLVTPSQVKFTEWTQDDQPRRGRSQGRRSRPDHNPAKDLLTRHLRLTGLLWRCHAILLFFLASLEKLLKLTSELWVQLL